MSRHTTLAASLVLVAVVLGIGYVVMEQRWIGSNPPERGTSAYLEEQKVLHLAEADVQLTVLQNAMSTDSSFEQLMAQATRLERNLDWALDGASLAPSTQADINEMLETLKDRLQSEDPAAADAADRLHRLLLDTSTGARGGEAAPSRPAAVRVAYLAGDDPRVNVRANGELFLSSVEAGSIGRYRPVESGRVAFAIVDASDDENSVLGPARVPAEASATTTLAEEAYYTLVVTGGRARQDSAGGETSKPFEGFHIHAIQDPLSTFPSPGYAWVRLVNVLDAGNSWSAHAVAADPTDRAITETSGDGLSLSGAVSFATSGTWVRVSAGTYRVQFSTAGSEGDPALDAEVAFYGGALYALYLMAERPGGRPSLIVVADAAVRSTPKAADLAPGRYP